MRARATSHAQSRGTLTVIAGCMFSGKTTELLRRLDAAPRCGAFKHAADIRYDTTQIVSHAGKAHPAIALHDPAELLSDCYRDADLIVIDEVHFFDEALIDVLQSLFDRGHDVVIAALQPDSWGRPFPLVSQLLERADETVVLHATCACGARADRTQRLTPIVDGQMMVSADQYEPRCLPCWRPPVESR